MDASMHAAQCMHLCMHLCMRKCSYAVHALLGLFYCEVCLGSVFSFFRLFFCFLQAINRISQKIKEYRGGDFKQQGEVRYNGAVLILHACMHACRDLHACMHAGYIESVFVSISVFFVVACCMQRRCCMHACMGCGVLYDLY